MLTGNLCSTMESYDPDCMLAFHDEYSRCFQSGSGYCNDVSNGDNETLNHWYTNSINLSLHCVSSCDETKVAFQEEANLGSLEDQKNASVETARNTRKRKALSDETKQALKRVKETGCLTPLIKEELKCTILARRLASGKEELVLNEEKPRLNQLTADDIRRRELRKEQNRKAARKYRSKQRQMISIEVQERHYLQAENALLSAEAKKLRQEREEILHVLKDHMLVCPHGPSVGNMYSIFGLD